MKKPSQFLAESKGFGLLTQEILTVNSMVQGFEKNQVYDASDVAEDCALAYEQVADLAAMVDAIKNKYEKTT